MTEKIRIALVDDQRLFRQSLAAVLQSYDAYELVLEAEDGDDCLRQLTALEVPPDVLLMDMEMPGVNGIELNEKVHEMYPHVKVLVLSVYNREKLISRMINAGASGYLEKNCDREELMKAIVAVHTSGFYMNATVQNAIRKSSTTPNSRSAAKTVTNVELTGREKAVLEMICREYSNSEIADALFISIRTAEGHRNNLLTKTGSRNTAGLVLFALKYGYLQPIF